MMYIVHAQGIDVVNVQMTKMSSLRGEVCAC